MQTSLLHAKAPGSMRALLLDSPSVVHPPEIDPRYIDPSPQHRAWMRKRLYGSKRDRGGLPYTYMETGHLSANYGDETPPVWKSTMKEVFVAPTVAGGGRKGDAGDVAKEMKQSHFVLEGPDGEGEKRSRTKRDYPGKDVKSLERVNVKEELKRYQRYPPIYRDETTTHDPHRYHSTYKESFDEKTPATSHPFTNPYPSRSRAAPILTSKSRTESHFLLGDDKGGWESTSKRCWKAVPIPRVERPKGAGEDGGKRGSLIEMVDIGGGGVGGGGSLMRGGRCFLLVVFLLCCAEVGEIFGKGRNPAGGWAYYVLPEKLDRKNLIVDMGDTIRDLKATHFQLGNETPTTPTQTSTQYAASFTPHPTQALRRQKRGGQESHVLEEDHDDRRMGTSSHRDDFKVLPVVRERGVEVSWCSGLRLEGGREMDGEASFDDRCTKNGPAILDLTLSLLILQRLDTKSSIPLDTTSSQPTPQSVTTSTFTNPLTKNPQAYAKPHLPPTSRPQAPPSSLPLPTTEHHSRYTLPMAPARLASARRHAETENRHTREYLTREHFTLGASSDVGRSTTRTEYSDPRARDSGRTDAAGGGGSSMRGSKHGTRGSEDLQKPEARKSDPGWLITLGETVGGPLPSTDFTTTTQKTYGNFPHPPSPPSRPERPQDAAGKYIAPEGEGVPILGVGTDGRCFTTVTRKSFVWPEVVRLQRGVVVGRTGGAAGGGYVGKGVTAGEGLIVRGGGERSA
ncbi:hypothetical protein HDV00_002842 [Rhizophlyctis rosea]|nr:hypothetical protein HDV00_002842 [Rhizophlyctis rosea]